MIRPFSRTIITVLLLFVDPLLTSQLNYDTTPVCADNSVALVIAKGYIPAGDVPGDVLLDAVRLAPFPGDVSLIHDDDYLTHSNIAPFPGDPSLDDYDDYLPEFFLPLIFGVGSVSGSHTDLLNGQVCFPVLVAEYVRGCIRQSTILYAFLISFMLLSDIS